MIKGIILDVDGVIVGSKRGFNWPLPHPDVINALKTLHSRGIMISLCTGKGTFAIKDIVEAAHLDNLHIGDGGAVVMDFLNHTVVDKHIIAGDLARQVVSACQSQGIYVEVYTPDGYYIQDDEVGEITQKHTAILNREPIVVESLSDILPSLEVIKIMPIAKDKNDKLRIISIFDQYKQNLTLQWGTHPTATTLQFGIITTHNISKKQAAGVISRATHIPLREMLGVGDGLTDWEFIRLCGYAGAMGNASEELKNLVSSRTDDTGFIGSGVNENGILDIFSHFNLNYR